MKRLYLKTFLKNKYSILLISLVALFLLAPLVDKLNRYFPITHTLIYVIILLTLQVLYVRNSVLVIVSCVGALAIGLEYLVDHQILSDTDNLTRISLLLSYILFLGSSLGLMIRNVFTEKYVSADTIKGGISIYLLLGFWWVFVYSMLILADPTAMISTLGDNIDMLRLYQFSFSTLTTVGYGNIIPRSELAITLSNFEAVAGQLYLTIFIARLVGFNLFKSLKK